MLPSVDILYLALQADMDGNNMEIIEAERKHSYSFCNDTSMPFYNTCIVTFCEKCSCDVVS